MYKIALPIEGIKTNLDNIQFGPITIFRLRKNLLPEISEENYNSLAIGLNSDDKFKFDSEFDSISFLEDALAIFRLFVCQRVDSMAALNIITKRKLWTYSELFEINLTNPTLSNSVRLKPGGRIYEYRLTEEHIAYFNQKRLPYILQLLFKLHKKESVSPLDELITKSSMWGGQMLEDTFYRDRFLRGVTALEAIVEKSPIKGISKKFTEFGAKLYFKFDKSYTQESLEESLKEIYKLRCNISHAGDLSFGISQAIFDDLMSQICFNALEVWMEVNSLDEFYNEINNCH
jgi:hypothetical protein